MAKIPNKWVQWRIQVVETLAGFHDFHVHKFSEHHYRLTLPQGRLDYWPNTDKARYLKQPNKYFVIRDIEHFINKKYKNE